MWDALMFDSQCRLLALLSQSEAQRDFEYAEVIEEDWLKRSSQRQLAQGKFVCATVMTDVVKS